MLDEFFDDGEEESVVVGFEGRVVPSCHGAGLKMVEDVLGALQDWDLLDEPSAGKKTFINLMDNWQQNCFKSVIRALNGTGVLCNKTERHRCVVFHWVRFVFDEGLVRLLGFACPDVVSCSADEVVFVADWFGAVFDELAKQKGVLLGIELRNFPNNVASEFKKGAMDGMILLRHADSNPAVKRVQLISWIPWVNKSKQRGLAVNCNC